jgi:hypothetical protein
MENLRFASPDLGMAGAIIRRVNPALWPKRGIPPTFRNYASLYEVLLLKSQDTDDGEQVRLLTHEFCC